MNILLVSSYLPVGGGISAWTEKYLHFLEDHNINCHLVDLGFVGKRTLYHKNIADEIKRTFRILRDMKKCVKEGQYDVVHINTSCSPFGIHRDALCVKMASKKRIPVVLHFHCNIKDQIERSDFSSFALKKMIRNASIIITLNNKSYGYIKSITNKKALVVPNFIEERWCIKPNDYRQSIKDILFIGHASLQKGIYELIKTARFFPDINFTVVGPQSEEIKNEKKPDNMFFAGAIHHDETWAYYRKSDVFVLPSWSEGFSVALLEAMACGLPVIASDVGANREMIEDQGGIIVKPKCAEDIINAINVLKDPKKRIKCSEWNVTKVREHYSLSVIGESLLNIYIELNEKTGNQQK